MNVPGTSLGWLRTLTVTGILLLSLPTFAQEVDATLQWVRTVPLSTAVSGVVDRVNVNKGERVRDGQVLMNLVSDTFQAEVLAQKAMLKKSENNNNEAQRELQRTQELYDRTLLSDHDLQLAKIQDDAATAELQTARAMLVKTEQDYYYSVVRAPFDAWIVQRNVQPGQVVIVNLQASPLLVLAEAGRMLARSVVKGGTVSGIRPGQKASVTVAGKNYTGKISFVAMQPVKPDADEYAVEVVFSTGKSVLRVGQSARVKF